MDIVERLRDTTGIHEDLIYEAADEIERLQGQVDFERKCRDDAFAELEKQDAEIVQLKKALERIADSSNWGEDGCWDADSYPDEIAKEALGDGIWDADNYLDEIAEEELEKN